MLQPGPRAVGAHVEIEIGNPHSFNNDCVQYTFSHLAVPVTTVVLNMLTHAQVTKKVVGGA